MLNLFFDIKAIYKPINHRTNLFNIHKSLSLSLLTHLLLIHLHLIPLTKCTSEH